MVNRTLLNVFPHEVVISRVNTHATNYAKHVFDAFDWLAAENLKKKRDWDYEINASTCTFRFRNAKIAMRFKLTWG